MSDKREKSKKEDEVLTLTHKVGGFTVIANGTTCTGNLKGDSTIHIDGELEGDIECHSITVGKTGVVKGKVIGENVFVMGRIEGEVITDALRLKDSAQVDGDLTVRGKMSMENGARIDGAIRTRASKPKLRAIDGTKSEDADEPDTQGTAGDDAMPPRRVQAGSLKESSQ